MTYFPLILLILTVASAMIGLIDKYIFEKKRIAALSPDIDLKKLNKKERRELLKPPFLADYARSLFWVFFIVLMVRSFVAQPYEVPTGSMLPTIRLKDFLLVNQAAYGLHWPVWGGTLLKTGEPQRGDIIVFHYPVNPQVDYIKTLIGLPGDHIALRDKKLYINGKAVPSQFIKNTVELDNQNLAQIYPHGTPHFSATQVVLSKEKIGEHWHDIYQSPIVPATDFNLVVPKGEYFFMGDNRDNSDDGRYWGFVKRQAIIGKAEMVLFSWDSREDTVRWKRIFKWLP